MAKACISKRVLDQLTRRKRVQDLRQEGLTEVEIAHQLGIAQGTVSKDLAAIARQLQAAIIENGLLAEEVERYRWVEREARSAWARSQKPKQKRTAKKKIIEGVEQSETAVTEEGQVGDAVYLAQVREAVTARLKALGLLKEKHEHSGPGGNAVPIQFINVIRKAPASSEPSAPATPEQSP